MFCHLSHCLGHLPQWMFRHLPGTPASVDVPSSLPAWYTCLRGCSVVSPVCLPPQVELEFEGVPDNSPRACVREQTLHSLTKNRRKKLLCEAL
mmetsp:Transcript_45504/g.98560  ORF Transcript_45504/g.98560 Transcript_45504/m.98560 type:complete len:93 (-) Transcript_45504:269-547(-)